MSSEMTTDRSSKPVTLRQYRALADFRYELRRFLRYSEDVTRRHGVTPLQYQVLLQVKGYPGNEEATVGGLAERLQAKHHGVVALVSRCGCIEMSCSSFADDWRCRSCKSWTNARGRRSAGMLKSCGATAARREHADVRP
jgi:hypothetical protein